MVDNKKNKTSPDPLNQANEAFKESGPILVKFLSASWNALIHTLKLLNILTFFKKHPWLFGVLFFIFCGLFPPAGLFFVAVGYVALDKGVKSENDFFIFPEGNDS